MSPPASQSFLQATALRRSLRALQNASPIPDSTVVEIAHEAIRVVPSAFNSQTTRLTVLFNTHHRQLWSITSDTLLARLGEERYTAQTKPKIDAFANSYGTILFWDDARAVDAFKQHTPDIYLDKVAEWVHQSNGMHQYYVWTALESHGLGANVQHFNPLIDAEVKKTWGVPDGWELRGQMVFGTPKVGTEPPERVQKTPVEERVQVFGAAPGHGQQ